jgi:hypothetical protein
VCVRIARVGRVAATLGMASQLLLTEAVRRWIRRIAAIALGGLVVGCLYNSSVAAAVAVEQLMLPSTSTPATSVFAWPGGAAISGTKLDGGRAENMFEGIALNPFKLTAVHGAGEVLAEATSPTGTVWLLTYGVDPPKEIPPPPGAPKSAEPKYTPLMYALQLYEMTAGNGVTLRHAFPETTALTDLPTSFAFGADGSVWFALPPGIERYELGGATTLYPVPGYPNEIVSGRDGALYFTQFQGNELGRVTLAGEVTEVPLPGASTIYEPPAGPYDLAVGPEGAIYVTEELLGRIARVTAGGTLREFIVTPPPSLPTGLAFRPEPRCITAGADGNMWFTDPGTNAVGRVTPGGEVSEYAIPPLPGKAGRAATAYDVPNAIAPLAGGLVFSETNVKAIGFVDPNGDPTLARQAMAAVRRRRRGRSTSSHTFRAATRSPTRVRHRRGRWPR